MDPDNMECSFQKQTKLKQIRNTYFFFKFKQYEMHLFVSGFTV